MGSKWDQSSKCMAYLHFSNNKNNMFLCTYCKYTDNLNEIKPSRFYKEFDTAP